MGNSNHLHKSMTQARQNAAQLITGSAEVKEEIEKLEQYYAQIGEIFIREQNGNIPQEYQQMYKRLKEAEAQIASIQAQHQESAQNVTAEQRQCPNCHAPLEANAIFCNTCGMQVNTQQKAQQTEPDTPHSMAHNAMPNIVVENYSEQIASITEAQLPERFKPIGAWAYFGWTILFNLPLIGWIIALVKALGNTENVNLKNFARSMFCFAAICVILVLIIFGTSSCVLSSMY